NARVDAKSGDQIIPVFLRIEKPLKTPDLGVFSPVDIAGYLDHVGDDYIKYDGYLFRDVAEAWLKTLKPDELEIVSGHLGIDGNSIEDILDKLGDFVSYKRGQYENKLTAALFYGD